MLIYLGWMDKCRLSHWFSQGGRSYNALLRSIHSNSKSLQALMPESMWDGEKECIHQFSNRTAAGWELGYEFCEQVSLLQRV